MHALGGVPTGFVFGHRFCLFVLLCDAWLAGLGERFLFCYDYYFRVWCSAKGLHCNAEQEIFCHGPSSPRVGLFTCGGQTHGFPVKEGVLLLMIMDP